MNRDILPVTSNDIDPQSSKTFETKARESQEAGGCESLAEIQPTPLPKLILSMLDVASDFEGQAPSPASLHRRQMPAGSGRPPPAPTSPMATGSPLPFSPSRAVSLSRAPVAPHPSNSPRPPGPGQHRHESPMKCAPSPASRFAGPPGIISAPPPPPPPGERTRASSPWSKGRDASASLPPLAEPSGSPLSWPHGPGRAASSLTGGAAPASPRVVVGTQLEGTSGMARACGPALFRDTSPWRKLVGDQPSAAAVHRGSYPRPQDPATPTAAPAPAVFDPRRPSPSRLRASSPSWARAAQYPEPAAPARISTPGQTTPPSRRSRRPASPPSRNSSTFPGAFRRPPPAALALPSRAARRPTRRRRWRRRRRRRSSLPVCQGRRRHTSTCSTGGRAPRPGNGPRCR